jgi:hypothetical protein
MNTPNTTRRALFAGAVALPVAAALPALAEAHLDAELMQLDLQYRAALAELGKRAPIYNARCEAAQESCRTAIDSHLPGDEVMRIFRAAEQGVGLHDPAIDPEPIYFEMDRIQFRAAQIPASTLAGLTVKVRIAAQWREPDVDTAEIDSLLADLKTLCGVA